MKKLLSILGFIRDLFGELFDNFTAFKYLRLFMYEQNYN